MKHQFNFDNFHAGAENHAAVESIRRLVDNPEGCCLLIKGYSASGKTHLLHAIAASRNSKCQPIYLRVDEVKTLLLCALRENRMEEFWDYFLTADMLLLDNVQYVGGMGTIIHSLASDYLQKSKHLVMAGDHLPSALSKIPSLQIIELHWPGYVTRQQIAKSKAADIDLTVAPEVLDKIAIKAKNSREIEGMLLTQLFSQQCSFHNRRNK